MHACCISDAAAGSVPISVGTTRVSRSPSLLVLRPAADADVMLLYTTAGVTAYNNHPCLSW